jgi:hypothetical protein
MPVVKEARMARSDKEIAAEQAARIVRAEFADADEDMDEDFAIERCRELRRDIQRGREERRYSPNRRRF